MNPSQKKPLLFQSPLSAGFPSPADDFADRSLDLNKYLIKHPAATFFVRVSGNSMIRCGITSGDLLIVDRSLEPKNNSVIVAFLNGEFTVKRIRIKAKSIFLVAENPQYKPIKIRKDMDFQIWGVVINVIKKLT